MNAGASSHGWKLTAGVLVAAGLMAVAGFLWQLTIPRDPIVGTYVSASSCSRLEIQADGDYRLFFNGLIRSKGKWTLLPETVYRVRDLQQLVMQVQLDYRSKMLPAHPTVGGHYIDTHAIPAQNIDIASGLSKGIIEPATLRRYEAPGSPDSFAFFFDPENPGNLIVTNGKRSPLMTVFFCTRQDETWFTRLWRQLRALKSKT